MIGSPMTIARLALILTGVVAFAYSMNTGVDWGRWVAIGCVATALALRIAERFVKRSSFHGTRTD